MTDQQQPTDDLEKIETNSSIFEKLPDGLRRKVNRAIADREPTTHKGIYAKYNLGAHGVSLRAFYRYARRLRSQIALFELGELAMPAALDVSQALPTILAQRLMEAVVLDDPSPRYLQRLADTYRIAANTHINLRKNATLTQLKEKKEGADLYKLMSKFRELVVDDAKAMLARKEAELAAIKRQESESPEPER
jgi:hypothetical protein